MSESSPKQTGRVVHNGRARSFSRTAKRVLSLAAIFWLARPIEAHAYVDPSTGSYMLQMLLAGILAAAFAVKMFWRNLKEMARRMFSTDRSKDIGDDSSTE
jgi:O-antigen/teichoic acid export membrane protein